jgi:ATP-dependent DNA ligase
MPPSRRKTAQKPSKSAPLAAMEARSVDTIPRGDEWEYEPKWDGFRCLLFRDGDKVDLRSKSGEDLTRYFPELADAARKLKATTFRLDGEIVVPRGDTFSFDDLLQRIHPAASRVEKLAQETPALYLAFDLLATAKDKNLSTQPLSKKGARRWKPLQRPSSNPIRLFGCRLQREAPRSPGNGLRYPAADATA